MSLGFLVLAAFCNLSLSRRIALAMVVSLVAVQAQALFQVWLFANPEVRLTGTRWLAETIGAAFQDVMARPDDQRAAVLRERSKGLPVRLRWQPGRPWAAPTETDPLGNRLAATLRDVLGTGASAIEVIPTRLLYMFPMDSLRVEVTPRSVAAGLGAEPVSRGQTEALIPASLRVAVQGNDGSWLSADPIGFVDAQLIPLLPTTALIAGATIIAVASTSIARRIVAPLDRLIVAAGAIGASRAPISVPLEGLGEFAAVARAFEDMQRRLIRFVSDRTQMLAAISHDLRSALTRLRIAAEAGNADAILTEADDMAAMLDSTLAFASGEAQQAPNQPVDIAALLISLVDDASDAGRRCGYHGPDHCVTAGHPLSLKRAFSNLIDNALKYGDAAQVRLEVQPGSLRVTVADEGPGIPVPLIEEAFRPFRRLDPARSGQPGAGLGLTIARDAVGSHGGTICLRPGRERGLEAVVELPRR